jgi:predicted ArsR family transcriptional regulator
MTTDAQIISAIKKMAPVSVDAVAVALKDDQGSVRQKMQRLRRKGLIEVSERKRFESTTKCYYKVAEVKKVEKQWDGYMSVAQALKFKKSLKGTPWEMVAYFL